MVGRSLFFSFLPALAVDEINSPESELARARIWSLLKIICALCEYSRWADRRRKIEGLVMEKSEIWGTGEMEHGMGFWYPSISTLLFLIGSVDLCRLFLLLPLLFLAGSSLFLSLVSVFLAALLLHFGAVFFALLRLLLLLFLAVFSDR